MSKETLEHISSLMDGELSRETGLFLTRRLSADEELTGTWERYHLIRDCLRHQGGRISVRNFSQRIKVALSEDVLPPRTGLSLHRWLKPVGGIAIAASVAAMAIVAIGPGQRDLNSEPGSGPVVERFSSPNNVLISPISQPASFSPQAPNRNQRLNSYLLRHNQLAGSVSMQGFVSFVPIISTGEAENPGIEDPDTSIEKAQEPMKP